MRASPGSTLADYNMLMVMQGKQKGNKGGIVRQKDQGYVDDVALASRQLFPRRALLTYYLHNSWD